jgi:hypothetical protein
MSPCGKLGEGWMAKPGTGNGIGNQRNWHRQRYSEQRMILK